MRIDQLKLTMRVLSVVDPVPNLLVNCFILGMFPRRIVARVAWCHRATFKHTLVPAGSFWFSVIDPSLGVWTQLLGRNVSIRGE
jgi:hypothetical protein